MIILQIQRFQTVQFIERRRNRAGEVVPRQIHAHERRSGEERVGNFAGEEVVLHIKIAERSERREEASRQRAGEGVVTEAERLELGEVGYGVRRQMTGESHSGEAELDDGGVVRVADDAGPHAGVGAGEVPEEDAAAYGRAEGYQSGSIGSDVRRGRGQEEEHGRRDEEEVVDIEEAHFREFDKWKAVQFV